MSAYFKSYLLLSFFIFPCLSFNQENNVASFFPLEIGNKWQYRVVHHDLIMGNDTTFKTVEILKDTLLANGKIYFYLSGLGSIYNPFEPCLIRFDPSKARLYYSCSLSNSYHDICLDNEYSIFHLGLPDSVTSYFFSEEGNYEYYAEYNVGFDQVGILPDSAKYKRYEFCPGGADIDYTFSENFGISAWSMGEGYIGEDGDLIYACIGGQEFGNHMAGVHNNKNPFIFELAQNYPNPFNNSTKIQYTVTRAGKVRLNIYNTSGQLIQTLVDHFQEQGTHSVIFTANYISSGIYFYRLVTDANESGMKKFIFIK